MPENRYWKTVSGRQEHMRVLQKLTGAALLVYIGSKWLTFFKIYSADAFLYLFQLKCDLLTQIGSLLCIFCMHF